VIDCAGVLDTERSGHLPTDPSQRSCLEPQ
jgi:hypothetical protein